MCDREKTAEERKFAFFCFKPDLVNGNGFHAYLNVARVSAVLPARISL